MYTWSPGPTTIETCASSFMLRGPLAGPQRTCLIGTGPTDGDRHRCALQWHRPRPLQRPGPAPPRCRHRCVRPSASPCAPSPCSHLPCRPRQPPPSPAPHPSRPPPTPARCPPGRCSRPCRPRLPPQHAVDRGSGWPPPLHAWAHPTLPAGPPACCCCMRPSCSRLSTMTLWGDSSSTGGGAGGGARAGGHGEVSGVRQTGNGWGPAVAKWDVLRQLGSGDAIEAQARPRREFPVQHPRITCPHPPHHLSPPGAAGAPPL